MIEKLAPEQEALIPGFCEKVFRLATSTEPADRPKAGAAALRLAEIAGVKIKGILWVNNPQEGKNDESWNGLRVGLLNGLWDSLQDSLQAVLQDSLQDSLRDRLWDDLRDRLQVSLQSSLRRCLQDSLWDSGWNAYYAFLRDHLGIVYPSELDERLRLHEQLLESCFAIWIVQGMIFLCERPEAVEIQDGKLKGLTWRK